MKNRIGTNSLIVAFSGFIVLEFLIHFGYISHWGWTILKAGFEAGTVGGMADWFAVRALFHRIPIPYVSRHTDIIAKNRTKLTEGIVDLVTNKWLSPEVISEKLDNIDLAQKVIVFLKKPDNLEKVIALIQKIVSNLADELDNPKLVHALKSTLTEQVSQLDLPASLGAWLDKSIRNGDHNQIWEQILRASADSINSPEAKQILITKLEEVAREYGSRSVMKRITMTLARTFRGIDFESVADELLNSANELISEAKYNPDHPIRSKFDNWLLDFANRLATGDENTRKMVDDFTARFTENADLEKIIQNLLSGFKNKLIEQLDNNDTFLMKFVISKLNETLDDLENNPQNREKVDQWIKGTISQLLEEFHSEIGNMVRSSLEKLDNKALVIQIEEKVGNDLQYIRLNGAVVGGLVGILITGIKLLLRF